MRMTAITALVLLCASLSLAQGTVSRREAYYVVELTGRDGSESYAVMTPEEVKAAQADIRGEIRYSMKALYLAQKEWAADVTNERKSFPRSAIGKRKIRTVGRPYKTRSEAEQEVADKETGLVEKARRDEERAKEKERYLSDLQRRSQRGGRRLSSRRGSNRQPGKSQAQKNREANREAGKQALEDKARALYEAKLAEVKQRREGGGAAPPEGGNL